jgi:uncharacterized damage-inducible protein DinB
MELKNALLAEIKHEASNTRKMLGRVPLDKLTWKPHEKSMDLHKLAKHVATIPAWISRAITTDEMDFSKDRPAVAPDFKTTEELLALFDTVVAQALKDVEVTSNETFMKPWSMRDGEKVYMTMPKIAAIRNLSLNHSVHHRGQLSVYLRLLNVPVPGMYGPTADEPM